MQFYNSDRVRFLDEVGEGTIIGFKGTYIAIIEDENGFEVEVHTSKLVKVSDVLNTHLEKTLVPKQDELKDKLPIKKKVTQTITPFKKEIDLHIENLVNSHKGLTNFEIVTIQLNAVRVELETAIRNRKTKRIIAIHGVGSGVLKAEIRNVLDSYDCVSYKDASYRKYGYGATLIFVK